jgi:hypothetical protein
MNDDISQYIKTMNGDLSRKQNYEWWSLS